MGIAEARREAQRRFTAERQERLEAEQAALAAQQAEAAEAERNKDRDERRESARRDARLNYLAKAGPLEATAVSANSAQQAFDAILADSKATVSTLFEAWTALQTATAVHAALRGTVERYTFAVSHPGQPLPTRYRDSAARPTFADVLDQVASSRAAVAASAAQVPPSVFAAADQAGDRAAKAVES